MNLSKKKFLKMNLSKKIYCYNKSLGKTNIQYVTWPRVKDKKLEKV